jgi:hypothetical protein
LFSSGLTSRSSTASADLEPVRLGELARFGQRVLAFEDPSRVFFDFVGAAADRLDDVFDGFLFALRRSKVGDFFGLALDRRPNDLFDHFFLLGFGRLFGVDAVFFGEFIRFFFDRRIARFADFVPLRDEFGLAQG